MLYWVYSESIHFFEFDCYLKAVICQLYGIYLDNSDISSFIPK